MSGTDAYLPDDMPARVRQRDGRVEPFDTERINRALFAATESQGQPDAFLARELTDSVLHFLAAEAEGGIISAEQIADTLVKVVRELGQPQIALALTGGIASGSSFGNGKKDSPPAEDFFSRNLIQAHREGLLELCGLEKPRHLSEAVVRLPMGSQEALAAALGRATQYTGETIVVDGFEYEFLLAGVGSGELAGWVRSLCRILDDGPSARLNVAASPPPPWAEDAASGPLFADFVSKRGAGELAMLRDRLAEIASDTSSLSTPRSPIHWYWHLSAEDFNPGAPGQARLELLLRGAVQGARITFVFDRPRRPVVVSEGIDRDHPALLSRVGLSLPALRRRQTAKLGADEFFRKILSLARLAQSAGVQQRDFLRAHRVEELPAFLLDQARLGLYLIGSEDLRGSIPEMAQLTQRLGQALDRESSRSNMACALDDGAVLATDGTNSPGNLAELKERLESLWRETTGNCIRFGRTNR